jgi:hypothetical protein
MFAGTGAHHGITLGFGSIPAPIFDVAIGKRQIATLVVTI